jgi:hypothetical protein
VGVDDAAAAAGGLRLVTFGKPLRCTGCGGPIRLSVSGDKFVVGVKVTLHEDGSATERPDGGWCPACLRSWDERMGLSG